MELRGRQSWATLVGAALAFAGLATCVPPQTSQSATEAEHPKTDASLVACHMLIDHNPTFRDLGPAWTMYKHDADMVSIFTEADTGRHWRPQRSFYVHNPRLHVTGSAGIQQDVKMATENNVSLEVDFYPRGKGIGLTCTLAGKHTEPVMVLKAVNPASYTWATLDGHGVVGSLTEKTYTLSCKVTCPAGAGILIKRIELSEESTVEASRCVRRGGVIKATSIPGRPYAKVPRSTGVLAAAIVPQKSLEVDVTESAISLSATPTVVPFSGFKYVGCKRGAQDQGMLGDVYAASEDMTLGDCARLCAD